MFKRLLALVTLMLVVGALVLVGALVSALPADAAPAVERCEYGVTYGKLDLPPLLGPQEQPGWMEGVLETDAGHVRYKVKATLYEGPATSIKERRGTLSGWLYPADDTVFTRRLYVRGEWRADREGKGELWTYIFSPLGPSNEPVGKMWGEFYDPNPLPNTPGEYKGEWGICL